MNIDDMEGFNTINIAKMKIFPITINFMNSCTCKIKAKRLFIIQRPLMLKMLFYALVRAFI